MINLKDQIINLIHDRSMKRLALQSKLLVTVTPSQKEAIAAGIYIEKQLLEACRLCLDKN